mmetsp:Transcript_136772/g.237534  ORF Transcript_136772/g.237534 Transcript_136772/m.237534 type:complete len:86 (+) Transcript_136772:247-504(+)
MTYRSHAEGLPRPFQLCITLATVWYSWYLTQADSGISMSGRWWANWATRFCWIVSTYSLAEEPSEVDQTASQHSSQCMLHTDSVL